MSEPGTVIVTDPESTTATGHVEVRRNAALAAALGLAASAVAIAYLHRASTGGSTSAWLVCLVSAAIGLVQLVALVDARTPLLVADDQGVRIRLGQEWLGLPWGTLEQVVVEQRDTTVRDGRLVLVPRNIGNALEELLPSSRRTVAWQRRLHGAPLTVPLSIGTRSTSRTMVEDLRRLALGRTEVVASRGRERALLAAPAERQPELRSDAVDDSMHARELVVPPDAVDVADDQGEGEHTRSGRRAPVDLGRLVSRLGGRRRHDVDAEDSVDAGSPEDSAAPQQPVAPEPSRVIDPVAAIRAARRVMRSEAVLDSRPRLGIPERRAEEPVAPVEDDPGTTADVVLIEDRGAHPAADPVIGPRLTEARTRAGLAIDELSDRTRIRPHVLEAMEVDDFGPCGGDFYARGHLRTLARYLGLDADDLVASYDARYAHAPINARRVFEAELATGMNGGMRSTASGPRWMLLAGAVLALAMVWGVARFFTEQPAEVSSPSPDVSDSAGLAANREPITSPLTRTSKLTLTTVGTRSHVVVRDRSGKVLWAGVLHRGHPRHLAGVAPFKVQTNHASATQVRIGKHAAEPLGAQPDAGHRRVG